MATSAESTAPLDYKIELLRKRYLIQLHAEGEDTAVLEYDIESLLTAHDAAELYSLTCKALGAPESSARVQGLAAAASAKVASLDKVVEEAEEKEGETEVREALVAKALFLADTGNAEAASKAFDAAEAKTAGTGPKLDLLLAHARLDLARDDWAAFKSTLERAATLAAAGGDWERRNRLGVYEAVACLGTRRFEKAAPRLLDALSTFTATELMSFEQCVLYAVLVAVLVLDRPALKSKVISSPEVLAVIDELPHAREFLNALYEGRYAAFFRAFAGLLETVRTDCFLHNHSRYFQREVRVKAYTQFLESYKSVTLASMASAFGVSVEFMDEELAEFIVQGRIAARMDRVAEVVRTERPDAKNKLYQQTIKQGDLLLARIQNLGKIIDLD